jgi:hypothetical protein
MKKFTFIIAFFFFSFITCFAQQNLNNSNINLLNDINGSPLRVGNERKVEGSPYFKNNFCLVTLTSGEGKKFYQVRAKLDLEKHLVIYTKPDADELELTPIMQIKSIAFTGCADNGLIPIFQSGFPSIGKQDEGSFYQVLDSGKATLLKYFQIDETQNVVNGLNPGAASILLQKVEFYFMYNAAKGMQKIAKSNDDVVNYFADKKTMIETFISSNKLKCKKEEDLIKVVHYYNSLN